MTHHPDSRERLDNAKTDVERSKADTQSVVTENSGVIDSASGLGTRIQERFRDIGGVELDLPIR
ncbi:hypothetical protein SAMN03159293_00683 [Pseudomonas sp. NFACC39-1]|nr:hypothetical protein SAMN03159293_00683 [Pseudomonas sp. NFACC39-1]SFH40829.1 hypothetical protein SAMN03159297_04989 [Pseudomonas sp. NFACC45]